MNPADLSEAYRVQEAVHGMLLERQGALIGHKIGCTSNVMQEYLRISHPCSGGIFATGCHASGEVLSSRDFVRVGVECEIAVRLAEDLPVAGMGARPEQIADFVGEYLPAIELVDDRYANWQTAGAPLLVADDFFAAGCVLGRPVPRSAMPDLRTVAGRAVVNGSVVGTGTGADVLGHPHNALAWLNEHLVARGKRLRKGDLVLTGSLVRTVWLEPGDHVRMDFGDFGTVAVSFT